MLTYRKLEDLGRALCKANMTEKMATNLKCTKGKETETDRVKRGNFGGSPFVSFLDLSRFKVLVSGQRHGHKNPSLITQLFLHLSQHLLLYFLQIPLYSAGRGPQMSSASKCFGYPIDIDTRLGSKTDLYLTLSKFSE